MVGRSPISLVPRPPQEGGRHGRKAFQEKGIAFCNTQSIFTLKNPVSSSIRHRGKISILTSLGSNLEQLCLVALWSVQVPKKPYYHLLLTHVNIMNLVFAGMSLRMYVFLKF